MIFPIFYRALLIFGLALFVSDTSLLQGAETTLRLSSIIGDNMVLQKSAEDPIWGWARPGEKVAVKIAGQELSTTTNSDGRWQVKLKPIEEEGPYGMTVQGENNSVMVKNILVGEVWICSGQSNMELPLDTVTNGQAETAAANYPKIRYYQVADRSLKTPATEPYGGGWYECAPGPSHWFSAVGYFFARKLHLELKVPVGMIDVDWGATAAEYWTSREGLESQPELSTVVDRLNEMQKANTATDNSADRSMPSGLYNGMIAPLIPYAIRGVIWYQGEGNTNRAAKYRALFPALIQDWRQHWGQGDFPFIFVQLPNYAPLGDEPLTSFYEQLREAQLLTLKLPATGMAVTLDVGEAHNIHPHNKQDVGLRLALWALGTTYGQKNLVYSGPLYKSMQINGSKIHLKFDHPGSGLISKGGAPLKYFLISGEDQQWTGAKAVIEGDTLVISSDKISKPVAVRYAWMNNPENPNFFNKEGLPASPFRTDDWTGPAFKQSKP